MRTIICKLNFLDGATVTATITARSAQGEYPITYEGAIERLPRNYATGNEDTLKSLFKILASTLDASIAVSATGNYDSWAE